MMFIKFEGFILALLLASFAAQSLSVHGLHHQERRLLEARKTIKETQENDAYDLKKELGSGSNEVRIGGRKMGRKMLKKLEEDDDKEDLLMANSRSRSISDQNPNMEADKNGSKEGPQDLLNNYQEQENMLGKPEIKRTQSSRRQGFSRADESPSLNKSNNLSFDEHKSEEWSNLLEEADKKVMQMLTRDYRGMRRPRRKPPINNHEPRD